MADMRVEHWSALALDDASGARNSVALDARAS